MTSPENLSSSTNSCNSSIAAKWPANGRPSRKEYKASSRATTESNHLQLPSTNSSSSSLYKTSSRATTTTVSNFIKQVKVEMNDKDKEEAREEFKARNLKKDNDISLHDFLSLPTPPRKGLLPPISSVKPSVKDN